MSILSLIHDVEKHKKWIAVAEQVAVVLATNHASKHALGQALADVGNELMAEEDVEMGS